MPDTRTTKYANWRNMASMLVASQGISWLGSCVVQYAMIWYITLQTQSGTALGISAVAAFLPQVLLAPLAGVWADRYNRRWLSVGADLGVAVSTVVIMIAFLTGYQTLWLMCLVLAARAIGQAVQGPAVTAMIPQIVPEHRLLRVNGVLTAVYAISNVVAPVIAGVLMALWPLGYIFIVDLATAAIGISLFLSFVRVRPDHVKKARTTSQFAEIKDGVKYLVKHQFLGRFICYVLFIDLAVSPLVVIGTLHVSRVFGNEAWRLSVMTTGMGITMVLSGVIISMWQGARREVTTIITAIGLIGLGLIVGSFTKEFWIFILLVTLGGFCIPMINSSVNTLVQRTCDPSQLGRTSSIIVTGISAVLPLGAALTGPLADAISTGWLLLASGVMCGIVAAAMYFDRTWEKIPPRSQLRVMASDDAGDEESSPLEEKADLSQQRDAC